MNTGKSSSLLGRRIISVTVINNMDAFNLTPAATVKYNSIIWENENFPIHSDLTLVNTTGNIKYLYTQYTVLQSVPVLLQIFVKQQTELLKHCCREVLPFNSLISSCGLQTKPYKDMSLKTAC